LYKVTNKKTLLGNLNPIKKSMINCGDPWRDLSKMQEFVSIRSVEAIKTVSYFNGFIAVCGEIERWAKLDRV
jgi:hypothetical protein